MIGNVYQTCCRSRRAQNKPEPDAAESCEFSDPKTYVCKLKPDLKFSSGDPLTAEDVKFSLDRMLKIADPTGPSSLLGSLDSVEVTDPTTVTMKLNKVDATCPFILTHNVGAIVPAKIYPADKNQPDDKVVGSGPYKLDKYTPNQQAVFSANPEYTGPNKAQTPNFIVQYFDQPSALKLAIEQRRGRRRLPLALPDRPRGPAQQGRQGRQGRRRRRHGDPLRIFNVAKEPVKDKSPSVRRSPRASTATRSRRGVQGHGHAAVLDGSGRVPGRQEVVQGRVRRGRPGQGQGAARRGRRQDAGRRSTPGTRRPTTARSEADLWNEIKRQLEATNLFKVNLDSTEWDQYKEEAFAKGTYYFYGLGWFPDFPDADNYLTPFMRDGGFFANGYENKEVNDLLTEEVGTDDSAVREEAFGKVQDIQAEDVPVIPFWEGKQVAAVREGVEGVEKTFDPAFLFRFWLVTKKDS